MPVVDQSHLFALHFIILPTVAPSVVASVIASRVSRRDWRQQEEGVRNSLKRKIMLSRSKHKVNVGLRPGCVSDVTEESSGASNSSINNLPSDDPPAYSSDHPILIIIAIRVGHGVTI